MKPLSCPSQFILWQQRGKNNFQEKELSHKCSTLVFVRLFVAAAATRPGTLASLCEYHVFESIATHDLI